VSLRLYDTSTRSIRDFVPLRPGRAGLYVCGATTQAAPHIGHIRSGVNYDLLIRWLEHLGIDVTFVRNVTDIDDKIITKSAEEGVDWWALSERNQRAFTWAYDVLGCRPPSGEPRATGHVPEMIVLIRRLIEAGHAYAAGGDVYFDVCSWDSYGSLSNQRLENMRSSADTASDDAKRDSRDFALWKGAKPGEPTWETPWGLGRPGWHLECSAMATKYLGSTFDIHGGGTDLVFPHHENEQAQSRAAGDQFARYWMHNATLTVGGEKMSKSLGNSVTVPESLETVRAVELRYYLGAAHYRSAIDFSEGALLEAAAAYQRLEGFVTRAVELTGPVPGGELPAAFTDAMNDDLGVPQALAVVHDLVREGNSALAGGEKDAVARQLGEVRAMLAVLGLDPLSEPWSQGSGASVDVIDALAAIVLEQRQAARERKDFGTADAIRDRLGAAGLVIEDTANGPRLKIKQG
jgi:cysteinyl-tRNA synthetase